MRVPSSMHEACRKAARGNPTKHKRACIVSTKTGGPLPRPVHPRRRRIVWRQIDACEQSDRRSPCASQSDPGDLGIKRVGLVDSDGLAVMTLHHSPQHSELVSFYLGLVQSVQVVGEGGFSHASQILTICQWSHLGLPGSLCAVILPISLYQNV